MAPNGRSPNTRGCAFVAVEASGVHRATRGAGRRRALLELEGELRRQDLRLREARGGAAVLPVAVEDAVELHVRVAHESIVDEHFVLVIALAADVGEPARREGRSRGGRTRVGGKTQPRPRLERRRLATGTILRGPEVVAPRRCRRAHTDLRARASTGIEARRLEAPLRLGRTSRASQISQQEPRVSVGARCVHDEYDAGLSLRAWVGQPLPARAPRAVASPTKRYNSSAS